MIIYLLLKAIYSVFSLLTTPINIPNMPEQVEEVALSISEYISMGIGILSVYTDLSYIMILFGVILTTDICVTIYKVVMWVVRKIPLVDIS